MKQQSSILLPLTCSFLRIRWSLLPAVKWLSALGDPRDLNFSNQDCASHKAPRARYGDNRDGLRDGLAGKRSFGRRVNSAAPLPACNAPRRVLDGMALDKF